MLNTRMRRTLFALMLAVIIIWAGLIDVFYFDAIGVTFVLGSALAVGWYGAFVLCGWSLAKQQGLRKISGLLLGLIASLLGLCLGPIMLLISGRSK